MAISSHRSRLLTAAVGLPLLAACVWFGGVYLLILFLAVSLAGLWEFLSFFPEVGSCVRSLSLVLGGAMLWLSYMYGPAAALAVPLAAFWVEEAARLFHKGIGSQRWLVTASLLYIPGSLQFLMVFGPGETALVMASVMATDTGGYYAGHLIGGPKIWPSVSPKKTWAGSIGGLAATVAVCLVAGTIWGQASLVAFAGLAVCLSVAAQTGDFMESSLKRVAGIKDSGSLLPGHGGILDRMDGFIPAVLVYALARSLTQYL